MKYPSRQPSFPKAPEWIIRVTRSLKKKLAPDVFKRAIEILHHPKTEEAWQLCKRAYGRDYPSFSEIIRICAVSSAPGMHVPSILFDKEMQTKYARAARGLLKATERIAVSGTYSIRSGVVVSKVFKKIGRIKPITPDLYEEARKDAEDEIPRIPDMGIINSIRMIAEYLEFIASIQRARGAPEHLGLRNILIFLEGIFRRDFGKPHYKIIACFWEATYPEKGEKTAEVVRQTIQKYRK